MKKLFLLLFMAIPVLANAQNDRITEICGVKFGTSYSSAKTTLEARFGKDESTNTDYLLFWEKSYAGISFDLIQFKFVASQLNQVKFTIFSKTVQEARSERDKIVEILKRKYSLTQKTDDDGEISYRGGTSPLNDDKYGFFVYVQASSILEEYPFVTVLNYGPYGYGDEF